MAHSRLKLLAILATCSAAISCGSPGGDQGRGETSIPTSRTSGPMRFANEDAAWGRFHSARFRLSVPLPEGRAWKIDDHRTPDLLATHAGTTSRLRVGTFRSEALVNRHDCERLARERGWVASANLTTIEDHVMTGPEAYDSRLWVALDAGRPDGALEGHVFLFGAFLRSCLVAHVSTQVPSVKDDEVLSSRLAVASTKIIGGLKLDPMRTTDDATVPKDTTEPRR